MNEVRIVPTARNSINPVPNAVRCGVQEARRASCVPEARYRYTISCVPSARSSPYTAAHLTQQSVLPPKSWTKKSNMKREKHSDEERLKVVERYLNCGSARLTAKEFGVDRHYVMEWAEAFRLYGIEGVMRRPPRKFDPEEKQKIILSCQKKSVPLHVISAIYGVSRASLKKWLKNGCERDAIHDLTKKRKMGRARKKVPETELELLKAENERLRAENALLKKVRALMAEREAHAKATGRKPSSH